MGAGAGGSGIRLNPLRLNPLPTSCFSMLKPSIYKIAFPVEDIPKQHEWSTQKHWFGEDTELW